MAIFNSLGSNYSNNFILRSLTFGRQKDTAKLKQLLNARFEAETILLTYKGREALSLVLKHLDLPDGSEVAVNGFTCYAVYQAITSAGFKPVYLDISKDDLNFSADTLANALKSNKKIKAVIVQNTLGMPAEISKIKTICVNNKLKLIEDLAHCVGMEYQNGKTAGSVGDASALSFSQDKIIDSVSGGAAVLNTTGETTPTKWSKVKIKQRIVCWYYPLVTKFIRKTYDLGIGSVKLFFLKKLKLLPGPMVGSADVPHILPNWYCKMAVNSFEKLESTIEHRRKIAEIYRSELPKNVQFKHVPSSIYLRFPALVEDREKLLDYLRKSHIYLRGVWYDAPVGNKKYFGLTDYKNGTCPESEYVSEHIINLPTHININEEEAHKIAQKVNEWLNQDK